MQRSRSSEKQIISILKEQEAGIVTAEVCRRRGISPATFYKWKACTVGWRFPTPVGFDRYDAR